MEILSMVNLGNLYTEFRKKNFTFCFRNKFLNFWQCHNAKYLKFMCITLDLHTSNLDLHRSRVDVCRSSLDLHTSIPGLSILSNESYCALETNHNHKYYKILVPTLLPGSCLVDWWFFSVKCYPAITAPSQSTSVSCVWYNLEHCHFTSLDLIIHQ